jgi:hypothetical protein
MLENRVVKNIFGPKGDEITGDWRKLRIEELHDLHSTNIIWVIKSRKIEMWVACHMYMGKTRKAYRFRVRKL